MEGKVGVPFLDQRAARDPALGEKVAGAFKVALVALDEPLGDVDVCVAGDEEVGVDAQAGGGREAGLAVWDGGEEAESLVDDGVEEGGVLGGEGVGEGGVAGGEEGVEVGLEGGVGGVVGGEEVDGADEGFVGGVAGDGVSGERRGREGEGVRSGEDEGASVFVQC